MQPSLFAREDTILGVCEGLGEELGLPPTLLRAAFAVGLFWHPLAMLVAYLTLGVALALFRWAFPMPSRQVPSAAVQQPLVASNDEGVTFAEVA